MGELITNPKMVESLDTAIANTQLHYIDKTYSGQTFGSNYYVTLGTLSEAGVPIGATVVSLVLKGWDVSGGTDCSVCVALNSAGTSILLLSSKNNKTISCTVRIVYSYPIADT